MPASPPPLFIVGLGGHARVVIALARAAGCPIAGLLDGEDRATPPESSIAGVRVVGGLSVLRDQADPFVAVAIGSNAARQRVCGLIREQCPDAVFPSLVHPTARVEADATIGAGVQICIGAIVGAGAIIREGALVNSGAIIDHECDIANFAHICPGVNLAGRVRVGERAQVGIGATVIQNTTIGSDAVIGAGAVVLTDVEPGVTVVGVPAKPVAKTR